MNLRTYEYIAAVARFKHFRQASDFCNVSQPTLSLQIKKFEDYYDLILFERDRKSVRLTSAGEKILPYIQSVLDADNILKGQIKSLKSPEDGEIILGAFPTLAPFYIPKIMPKISKTFPNLKVFWVEDRSPDLIKKLKSGELDAAFLALPLEDDRGLDVTPLFDEPLLAAVPATSRFAEQKILNLKDLKEETLLLLEDSHCLSGQALEACEWAGYKNRHDFRATSIETLRQMVGSGLGITLMPQIAIDSNNANVRYIPLKDGKTRRTIGLVHRKTSTKVPILDKFSKILNIL